MLLNESEEASKMRFKQSWGPSALSPHLMKSTLLLNFNASSTILVTEEGVTLDDAIKATGGFGRYHGFLIVFYVMSFMAANFLLYNIDPLTQQPIYMCEVEDSVPLQYYECTAEEICESNFTIPYKIDEDDVDSLENWVQTLDLMCTPEYKIYRISWVYYIGEIVGCILISRIPDLYGRKLVLAICNAIQFPLFIAVLYSKSLSLTTAYGFFMGILHKNIYDGAYINIGEYFETKWKTPMCTLLLVFDMLSVIMVGFYWRYVSKDWLWL
jgi:hypothetical protein